MANEYDGFISTGFDKIGEDFFKDLNGKLKIIAVVFPLLRAIVAQVRGVRQSKRQ